MPSKFMIWDVVLCWILVLIFKFVFNANYIDIGFFVIVWIMGGEFADISMRMTELSDRMSKIAQEVEQLRVA
jgi:hypothetical protein